MMYRKRQQTASADDFDEGPAAIRRKLINVPAIRIESDDGDSGNNVPYLSIGESLAQSSQTYVPWITLSPSRFPDRADTAFSSSLHAGILSSSPSPSPPCVQKLSLESDTEMDLQMSHSDCHGDATMELDTVFSGNENQAECNIRLPRGTETTICFGMIFAAMKQTRELNAEEELINSRKGFDVIRRRKTYYVLFSPATCKEIGVIDLETEQCLRTISELKQISLKSHILTEPHIPNGNYSAKKSGCQMKTSTQSPQIPTEGHLRRIMITVYGPQEVISVVGKNLSSKKKYLQEPDYFDFENSVYENPHEFKPRENLDKPAVSRPLEVQHTNDILADENLVSNILDSILPQTILEQDDAGDCISTPLFSHQKEALCFIRQQESGVMRDHGLWEKRHKNGQSMYLHRIKNISQTTPPQQLRGGILADQMGLGKTLVMLATIVRSLSEARSFVREQGGYCGSGRRRLHGTLVILPLSVLSEWESEIRKHIIPSSANYHKYHVGHAKLPLGELIQFDIVLTTYDTLAMEYARGGSPLFNAEWFRIVLDEAHYIRNRETKKFRAVTALSAQRRWCLTGTPTQNKLGDLCSLFLFLRIPDFENQAALKRYILRPLDKNDVKGVENLRTLLASCCLKRNSSILSQLLEVSEKSRLLHMSVAEKTRYQKTIADCERTVARLVGRKQSSKVHLSILQTITQLRLLCNHGITLPTRKGEKRSQCSPEGTMDLDDEEMSALDPVELLNSLEVMDKAMCAGCETKITSLIDGHEQGATPGYLTSCSHLLCVSCLPDKLILMGRNRTEQFCHLCGEISQSSHVYTFDSHAADSMPDEGDRLGSTPQYELGNMTMSTKIVALMEDIEDNPAGEKCIVFSGWAKTLDLVESHLGQRNIAFGRVDGKVDSAGREAILEAFRTDPQMLVLLMTIGCGAVGLNLTVASRIHLIEPQWNPMVEKQAVGRVRRLGQTQPVSVYRYIMKGTIEESIQSRQLQKAAVAELVSGTGNGTQDMMLRMKNLRQLI